MSVRFDCEAFYVALDKRRRERHLERGTRYSWREVSRELGLSQSTFTRLGIHHAPPNAENLVRLLAWLGETDLKPYLTPAGTTERDPR